MSKLPLAYDTLTYYTNFSNKQGDNKMQFLIARNPITNKVEVHKNGVLLLGSKYSFSSMKKAVEWLRENDQEYVAFVAANKN